MIFNSIEFLIFLPLFMIVYFATKRNLRLTVCLVGSYIFYGWWDWKFLGLILLTTVVAFVVGMQMSKRESARARKGLLLVSLVISLGVLGVYKYFDFFIGSLQEALGSMGMAVPEWELRLILPVGISFYTFQTLSYTIDVYRRQLDVECNFIRFAAYVAFFPQLVAGPIVRASTLLPQLREDRRPSWNCIVVGLQLILLGFFKKVVVADSAAPIVDSIFRNPELFTSLNVILGVYLYAVQIYCDFSGYSDIAIGIGRLLGFDFGKNFDKPYFSSSFSEFWRRWHISLSSWLRDYLYISLGGNRKGTFRTYVNLMLTMLLGGLWHGAAWTFVVWGALHGAYLVGQRLLGAPFGKATAWAPKWMVKVFLVALVFHLTCLAWIFFRAEGFGNAMEILGRIASLDNFSPGALKQIFELGTVLALSAVLIGCEWVGFVTPAREFVAKRPALLVLWCALILWAIALFGNYSGNSFIYFQF